MKPCGKLGSNACKLEGECMLPRVKKTLPQTTATNSEAHGSHEQICQAMGISCVLWEENTLGAQLKNTWSPCVGMRNMSLLCGAHM